MNAPFFTKEKNGMFSIGYKAVIETFELPMQSPIPLYDKKVKGFPKDNEGITMLEALFYHIQFALKNEGVDLLFFALLSQKLEEEQLIELVQIKHTGETARRIWFLVEFASKKTLPIPDLKYRKEYVNALDENIQFGLSEGIVSKRHRVINNLPGTSDFCPLATKTDEIVKYTEKYKGFSISSLFVSSDTNTILIEKMAYSLLLKDSKSSFIIEGEKINNRRAQEFAKVLRKAGKHLVTDAFLLSLQQEIMKGSKFNKLGFRTEGGFIGEHDYETGEPIPSHISARHEDIAPLMNGLYKSISLVESDSNFDSMIAAATVAFGFVNIHPFFDGNGRVHRYLINHILSLKKISLPNGTFPISAAIRYHIEAYSKVLSAYSNSIIDYIDWVETEDLNVKVLSDSAVYYRFFDATAFSLFLYECFDYAITVLIPNELTLTFHFNAFKEKVKAQYDMEEHHYSLLFNYLEQGNGLLSKNAIKKFFNEYSPDDITYFENCYQEVKAEKTL
ncbi:Fic family protein [Flammeovirga pacifica]|uniref:Fido domain-containing protein n=1 Tax=Flammeovirga pacifica TaxID=915059 RepID=A0A1S1YVS4_FLAPC|nr:Fic family protein [Flammeovirga pacifica]OHX65122.1 hypothetical protein NH26_01510 [Flammeovirga pacifica]